LDKKCIYLNDFPREARSVIVLFHMGFRLSSRSKIHFTPIPAYGAKLIKIILLIIFLINNDRWEKQWSWSLWKVKININVSQKSFGANYEKVKIYQI